MSEFPRGWAPIQIRQEEDGPSVDWCHLEDRRFREPFFDQTIELCLRSPFNQLFRPRTSMTVLSEARRADPGLPPTGFIFHMSRCGSTLVAQMLAALAPNIVISEAPPIDAVIRSGDGQPHVSEESRLLWLRSVVSALAQPRFGERHFFVKLDCWHILELPLLREAFPSVPWIFLFRDPLDVLVSQLKMRGAQMVPGIIGPSLFGIDAAAALHMPAAEYCARILAAICGAALRHFPAGGGLLVNYDELPDAVWTAILPHFGVECTAADIAAMREAAKYDAKTPLLPFESDRSAKKRDATAAACEAAATWLDPLYRELEALRGTTARSGEAGRPIPSETIARPVP
jgi:hypothetical protein